METNVLLDTINTKSAGGVRTISVIIGQDQLAKIRGVELPGILQQHGMVVIIPEYRLVLPFFACKNPCRPLITASSDH